MNDNAINSLRINVLSNYFLSFDIISLFLAIHKSGLSFLVNVNYEVSISVELTDLTRLFSCLVEENEVFGQEFLKFSFKDTL